VGRIKTNPSQSDLAKVFGRSQRWVSEMQSRTADPMPKDMEGALAWGKRNGRLPGEPAPGDSPAPAGSAPSVPLAAIELAEIELKQSRSKLLQYELSLKTGKLLSLEEVEHREVIAASEFRRIACAYPVRVRGVLERHIDQPALVEAIVSELQPLAADLLNATDQRQVLRGKSRDEIRAILMLRVEELVNACL